MAQTKFFHHGRFALAGGVLPDAVTAYRTYGDPKNPCIVFPTCYGAKVADNEYMIGSDKAFNPDQFYIVTFALFSNGESSSPSNTPTPYNGPYFPAVTYEDNARAQYAVLTKELGVTKVYCVAGFSMGGQQAYYWAVMYPEFVERFICICGSARTSPHNQCFLEGPKAALVNAVDFKDGHYEKNAERGLRAFGRAYSAWAYGQSWFRRKAYLKNGMYTSLDDWLRAEWETSFYPQFDANDVLSLLRTWQLADVSKLYAHSTMDPSTRPGYMKVPDTFGDLHATLGAVKAKGLIMPSRTDLYFPPEDSTAEVDAMKSNATLVVVESDWGHIAGGGGCEEDTNFIRDQTHKFFRETS
ncbi:hypothetical protein EIP91_003939 [Steccherinum ochraceum]|uniref:AB hydrolase-1 domain-containing protein n=1 Tax=Steccherinum ochraceum TaxID=92696 RepID=A0A4R0RND7_9APHY|nr:hypothetical protein EIP91_003939 [Steccherinum ochraceum]